MRKVKIWNDGWTFIRKKWEEIDCNQVERKSEPVTLPHTWYKDGEYYQGDAVYQKVFKTEKTDKKYFLVFEGVEKKSKIFVNGRFAGEHQGAYSSFAVRVDPFLKEGENLITVLVNNGKDNPINPASGDFTIFGGICRPVKLLITEDAYFDPLYYGTQGIIIRNEVDEAGNGICHIEPHVCVPEAADQYHIRYKIYDAENCIVADIKGNIGENAAVEVKNVTLWEGMKNPYLYRVSAELVCNGKVEDEVSLETGFRRIKLDPNEGFFLNEEYVKLRGVAKHQDTAEVFSAVSEEDIKRDFELIREIGANAVRLSHYQHPQKTYQICDSMGLLVWTEIPFLKLTKARAIIENAKEQLKELILQNIHHPSVCFWGIQNEIAIFGEDERMYQVAEELNSLVKSLDKSRFSVCANLNTVAGESRLNQITDGVGYNLYFGWYYGEISDYKEFLDDIHEKNPKTSLAISEYGADCNPRYHSEEPKRKDYSEEFQAEYHESVYPLFKRTKYLWGSFVWNMFDFVSGVRDEGGVKYRNNKGLVTHDRKVKKDAFYYYKAQWSLQPFVWIAEKRFAKRNREDITIKIYSNQKEVTLKINGTEQKIYSENGVFRFSDLKLQKGENQVHAYAGGQEDRAVFSYVDEELSEYVYVDPNPGPNVRNWYEDEVEKAKLFPEDAYSIMDTINDLLKNESVMETIDAQAPAVGAFMRDTIGTFTLEEMCVYAKTLITEDNLKKLNQSLIQIQKD